MGKVQPRRRAIAAPIGCPAVLEKCECRRGVHLEGHPTVIGRAAQVDPGEAKPHRPRRRSAAVGDRCWMSATASSSVTSARDA